LTTCDLVSPRLVTPPEPLIFLVKVRGFLFQLVSWQTMRSRHFGGGSGGYLAGCQNDLRGDSVSEWVRIAEKQPSCL
jgi:hypothetical protein